MFNYPYGDNQQINLNWIISEIIALHQRLDPDYTAPTFTQIYPFSDTQQLNLDWILTELKALKELAPTPAPTEEIDEIGQALIAGAYDATKSYQKNDYIVQDGKVYRANAATTGTFDPTKWNDVLLGDDLAIITRWADATNTFLNSLAASNVANDSSVTGTTVKDALDTLKNAVPAMTTDNVTNESGVTGATATAALNTLNSAISAEATARGNADTALQNAISAETTARENADTTLQTAINGKENTLLNVSETCTLTVQSSDFPLYCYRYGKIVWLNTFSGPKTLTAQSGWITIGQLTSNYRPPTTIFINTRFNDTNIQIRIETNGNISFAGIPAIADAYLAISITYLVN